MMDRNDNCARVAPPGRARRSRIAPLVGRAALLVSLAMPVASAQPTTLGFSGQPSQVVTNLPAYIVTEHVEAGALATVNGVPVEVDDQGYIATRFPIDPLTHLQIGPNVVELQVVPAAGPAMTFAKTITYEPGLSTAAFDKLYVDSTSPRIPGTIVIDVGRNIYLGIIDDKHVRAGSPDRSEIYFSDRTVMSTATHRDLGQPRSPLAFSQDIPHDAVVVSHDGRFLFSRAEILELASNTVVWTLPSSIATGESYGGYPNPGGPVISPDDTALYCCLGAESVVRMARLSEYEWEEQPHPLPLDLRWQSDLVLCGGELARITYAGQSTFLVAFYDVETLARIAAVEISGDFAGEGKCAESGRLIVGAAGNPRFGNGGVAVVDVGSHTLLYREPMKLADNVTVTAKNEVFAASAGTAGVDRFTLHPDGTLEQTVRYVLGINEFVATIGTPRNDEIRRIINVPAQGVTYRVLVVSDTAAFADCWVLSDITFDAERSLMPEGDLIALGNGPAQLFLAQQTDADFRMAFLGLVDHQRHALLARGGSASGDVYRLVLGAEDPECQVDVTPPSPYDGSRSPADVLFFDDFDTTAPDVDRAAWTTPEGDAAFFGRTAIRNPDSVPGDEDLVPVVDGSARLRLSTHNPTALIPGDSFWGSQICTVEPFEVTQGGVSFKARIRVPAARAPGMVSAVFGYGFTGSCPTCRDELDFELVSNLYQPAVNPPAVLLNRYADEPDGVGLPGHPTVVETPDLDYTQWQVIETRWYPERVEWYLGGRLLDVATVDLPTAPLSLCLNIWAPDAGFALAYSDELQPVADVADNVDYEYAVDWVMVAGPAERP